MDPVDPIEDAVRIMIADDHDVMRIGLRALIESQPDLRVVADCSDGSQAIKVAQQQAIDVALVDIGLPDISGIDVTREIVRTCPQTKVLVFTALEDPKIVHGVIEAGGSGYLTKSAVGPELLAALRTVHQGRIFLSAAQPMQSLFGTQPVSAPVDPALSNRERQVLELVAQGHTSNEIGDMLGISPRTVGTYRNRIAEKLGLRTRAEITRYVSGAADPTRHN